MGRTGGVKIYELMGDEGSENMDQLKALAGQFESAFEFYLNRQWHEALDILESIKENNPNNKPISILQERCKSYLDEDPEPSWSGIVRLDAK
jgi:predicted Zn-dependent protease